MRISPMQSIGSMSKFPAGGRATRGAGTATAGFLPLFGATARDGGGRAAAAAVPEPEGGGEATGGTEDEEDRVFLLRGGAAEAELDAEEEDALLAPVLGVELMLCVLLGCRLVPLRRRGQKGKFRSNTKRNF